MEGKTCPEVFMGESALPPSTKRNIHFPINDDKILRSPTRYLRFSEGVSPASFFFLEPPDFELYGVSLLFAFPFFFLFLPPSYSKSESLSGSERSSYIESQHISILILSRVLQKQQKKKKKTKKLLTLNPAPIPTCMA